MKQDVMSCSAKAPMCPCYKALAEKKGAESKKNCGCGQDPCKTYGAESFSADYDGRDLVNNDYIDMDLNVNGQFAYRQYTHIPKNGDEGRVFYCISQFEIPIEEFLKRNKKYIKTTRVKEEDYEEIEVDTEWRPKGSVYADAESFSADTMDYIILTSVSHGPITSIGDDRDTILSLYEKLNEMDEKELLEYFEESNDFKGLSVYLDLYEAESFGADTVLNQESLDFEAGHLNTLYNQYEACPKHPMGKGHGWFPTHQCKHCGKADEFMGISNIHEDCPKHPMGKGHGWFNTNQCKHCGKVDEFMSAESFSADTECDDGCAWELGYVGKGASFGGNNEMNWDIHIYCPVCRTTLDFKAIPQDITGSPVANYFKGNKEDSFIKERRKIYGEVCLECGDQIDNPLDIKKGLCYWHQPENKEEILNWDKEHGFSAEEDVVCDSCRGVDDTEADYVCADCENDICYNHMKLWPQPNKYDFGEHKPLHLCLECYQENWNLFLKTGKQPLDLLNAESHAYSYAYNDGHSDSRKGDDYRPNLSGSRQEADFKKILKQKAESFEARNYGEPTGIGWAKRFLKDKKENQFRNIEWYLMMGNGERKTIKGVEYAFFGDGSALTTKETWIDGELDDIYWELASPIRIDKKTGKGVYVSEYIRDSDGRFSSKSAISLTTAAIIGLAGAYLWRGKK